MISRYQPQQPLSLTHQLSPLHLYPQSHQFQSSSTPTPLNPLNPLTTNSNHPTAPTRKEKKKNDNNPPHLRPHSLQPLLPRLQNRPHHPLLPPPRRATNHASRHQTTPPDVQGEEFSGGEV
ncbi:hypothetical protein HYFRA_00009727 [Hymenoscyphus fraxineus]|uniref:Uncharacterized protein n=1 Tax=Hymenoscyphus fraxineus TaxID=746836 RepID=A0A9N9KT38_9HELO|nr:hypothetical protein HYFRA_00009727 [Hymenoscyphus fraxineus]